MEQDKVRYSGHELGQLYLYGKTTSALSFATSNANKNVYGHEEKLHSPVEHFGFFLHLNLV
jgi:hypothetical protein